jgi:hypothetical protein
MSITDAIGEEAVARRKAHIEATKERIGTPTFQRPANVRPAYQNTSDAMEIAVRALELAASSAKMEGAPPPLADKLNSLAARLAAHRMEVMKGNPG